MNEKVFFGDDAGSTVVEDMRENVNSIKSSLESVKTEKVDAQKAGDEEFVALMSDKEAMLKDRLNVLLSDLDHTDGKFRDIQQKAREVIGNDLTDSGKFCLFFDDQEKSA